MISSNVIVKAVRGGLKSTKDVEGFSSNLLSFLEKNNLIHLLPNILRKLEAQNKKEKDFARILIKTSHEFSPETISGIKKKFGLEDKTKVDVEVDQSIIGGFVVFGRNKILDASVRRNIISLKESLIK